MEQPAITEFDRGFDPALLGSVTKHYLQTELEDRMRGDAELWDVIQNVTSEGVWYWSLEDPRDEWISDGFWQALGIDAKTMADDQKVWRTQMYAEDLDRMLADMAQLRADPGSILDAVCRYHHADGSTAWLRCRAQVIRDEQGHPIRMLATHTDQTQIRRLENLVEEKTRALDRANEDLRTFAYGISHDLKSPANTAKMLIAEIRADETGALSDDQSELLEYASKTIDRMSDLIEGVLEYARLVGEMPETGAVSLDALVQDIVEDHRDAIVENDAVIEIDPLPTAVVSQPQFRAMFHNLIENALKYSNPDERPSLRITADESDDRIEIRFVDNGLGIEPRHQKRIFDMFARLHTRDLYPGTGLGLSVCERVARNHRGRITVRSAPGAGSTFTVTVPKGETACTQ